jgi:hypothetical protein
MTTPVGTGKNACFGFEEDHSEAPGGAPPNEVLVSRAASESLVCEPPAQAPAHAAPRSGGCALTPDYYTLSGSAGFVLTAAGSATVDRYGHVYTAGGGGLGAGVGAAAHAGYLRDPDHPCDAPDEATLRSFLSGPAVSAGGGAVLSVGVTHSSGMTAREVGLTTPQLGVTYTLGAEHDG